MNHAVCQEASVNAFAKGLTGNIITGIQINAFFCAAVFVVDNHILGNIHQAAGQVTSIRRTQSGIRQTLTRAVGGDKVLQRAQAFTEV